MQPDLGLKWRATPHPALRTAFPGNLEGERPRLEMREFDRSQGRRGRIIRRPRVRTCGVQLPFARVLLVAAVLVTPAAAQQPAADSPMLSPGRKFAEQGGAAIYANACAACHQPDAKGAIGAGAYPGLAANPDLASADDVLRVVIGGLRGMPPLGGMLSDEQVADVVNYVRSHFGNDYRDRVSAAAVQAARAPSPGP
jgi:mono/diheme cytochrome c family protein